MLHISGSVFDPYLLGDALGPEGHAARHGVTVTTYEDLDMLVTWAPDANLPFLDRNHTPWLLYSDDAGDGYAGTIPCRDDDILARCNLEDLRTRGPLYVLFNGDHTTIAASDDTTPEER
jgi:hypothetical protein